MLTPLSSQSSQRLRAFFADAGYTEPNLRTYLGAAELPSRRLRNQPRLLDRTSAPTLLNALLRWFWLGCAQNQNLLAGAVPDELFSMLLETGLVEANGEWLTAAAMVLPIDDVLVASDHPSAFEQHQSELVLWPNPTSKFLNRFAVRSHSSATLDLGAGGGILSLYAARHSDLVTATDLNPRAIVFAKFNAWLNGVDNIEFLIGDCFAPVSGRKFDLILSNPPFFITPQTDYLFCDNPIDLDGLCRRLVKEAPAHLNEGGYMQMLCEWAQISGQPWEERIAEWLQDTGCDAWVMKGWTQNPAEYAQHRISETSSDASKDAGQYEGYMEYYNRHGVEAIHDGLIVMRRRTGTNWVRIEEVPKIPTSDMGKVILASFAAHDLLEVVQDDAKLLAMSPQLVPHVRLEQICAQVEGRWQPEVFTLRLITGFPFNITVQPLAAEFLGALDGTKTTEEAIQSFAASANAPLETVRRECLAMIRKLIERGFFVVPDSQ